MKRVFLLLLSAAFALPLSAREVQGVGKNSGAANSGSMKTVEELCQPSKAQSDLSINNVRATILGGGDMWWDLNTARYEVPKGSNKHSMFAGSLWLGGVDEGNQLKLAAMTYRQSGNDYWPGPLTTDGTASTNKEICDKYDRHWIIYREEVDVHKAWLECLADPNCDDAELFPGYESQIPQSIKDWPGNGVNGELPYQLAPFIDRDGDGVYDYLVDYPAYDIDKEYDCRDKETDVLYGDQTIWWVYNDRGNVHTESQAGALGFEIRAQAFAFSTNDEVNNMTFNNYRIINRSTFRLTNTYFSTWFDPDLGNYTDDIIGCDIARGLGYCYNSDTEDEGALGYGLNPPAVGFDFFQGPFADYYDGLDNDRDGCVDGVQDPETGVCIAEDPSTGVNERIIMSQFMYYNNTSSNISGNPDNATHFYNYMRALWKNGSELIIETPSGPGNLGNGDGFVASGNGTPTRFAYPGMSYDTTGAYTPYSPVDWWESPANKEDKRGLHSAGPFSLAPGALNFVTTGVVWERDLINNDLFASVEKVIIADDKAQKLFDNCFQVLNGPDAPDVTTQELNREIILKLTYGPGSNNAGYSYRERDPLITVSPDDRDSILNANPDYFDYKFEGFQIFQLANSDVSISDIYDPTQSRMVAQCDIKNDLTQLINWEVDPDMNALVPKDMTLQSNNSGIFTSFKINEDQFATGDRTLINHKEYYFTVIAYGQNQYLEFNPITAAGGQKIPFLAGRRNIKTYTAIPHQIDSEKGGTIQVAEYGDGPIVRRMDGVGNGGTELELLPEEVTAIMNGNASGQPSYMGGMGPVAIKVVDPLEVKDGEYTLTFSSANANANWQITDAAGNVIVESDTTISFYNEQIVPDLGLSVAVQQAPAPGGDDDGTYDNGVIFSEIIYEDPSKEWWAGIQDDKSYTPYNWILAGTNSYPTEEPATLYPDQDGDAKGYFENIVGGTWGPYMYASGNNRVDVNGYSNFGMGPAVSIGRNLNDASDLHSVDIVFTTDHTQWTRVPVFELAEEAALSEHGDKKLTQRQDTSWILNNGNLVQDPNMAPGWSYFPGYAIDVESGKRLTMAFGENSWLPGQNGNDMLWNPTDVEFLPPGNTVNGGYVFGGQHYIYVFADEDRIQGNNVDLAYSGPNPNNWPIKELMENLVQSGGLGNIARANFWRACRWVGIPTLRKGLDFDPYTELPTNTRVRIRMNSAYQNRQLADAPNGGVPQFQFNTSNIATRTYESAVGSSALETIRVVPNPYYGFSSYEASQLDNIVKITNLPETCTINIFSTSGTLVRQLRKDNSLTYVEWDLKNTYNVPIASGVYIIHVDAGELGEKVVKWFGALRPVDLNSF